LPDPLILYVSIPMCNGKWLCLAILYILFWQVPHQVVFVPNDGFREYNEWLNEWKQFYKYNTVLWNILAKNCSNEFL
jgi:hypothetical protein